MLEMSCTQSSPLASPRISSTSSNGISASFSSSSHSALSSNNSSNNNPSTAEIPLSRETSSADLLTLASSMGFMALQGERTSLGSPLAYGGFFENDTSMDACLHFGLGPGGCTLPAPVGRKVQKPPRSPLPARTHTLYKTELCRGWLEAGTCRYGMKCQFAHGQEELRPVPRHPKYKTELCRSFLSTGTCAYGPRCRFIHSRPTEMGAGYPGIDWTSALANASTASSPRTGGSLLSLMSESPAQPLFLDSSHSVSPLNATPSTSPFNAMDSLPRLMASPMLFQSHNYSPSAAAAAAGAARTLLQPQATPNTQHQTPHSTAQAHIGASEFAAQLQPHASPVARPPPSHTTGVAASILSQVRALAASSAHSSPRVSMDRSSSSAPRQSPSPDSWHLSPAPSAATASRASASPPPYTTASPYQSKLFGPHTGDALPVADAEAAAAAAATATAAKALDDLLAPAASGLTGVLPSSHVIGYALPSPSDRFAPPVFASGGAANAAGAQDAEEGLRHLLFPGFSPKPPSHGAEDSGRASSLEALLGALQEQRTPAVDAAHPLRSIWSTNGSSLNPTFACQTSSGKPERHDLPTRSQRGQFDL